MTIVDELIKKCIVKYSELYSAFNSKEEIKYGKPPEHLVVEYIECKIISKNKTERVYIKSWDYFFEKSFQERLKRDEADNIIENKMFFERAKAYIYYNINTKKAYLELMMGPRFGTGFSYSINENNMPVVLENEKVEWIS